MHAGVLRLPGTQASSYFPLTHPIPQMDQLGRDCKMKSGHIAKYKDMLRIERESQGAH